MDIESVLRQSGVAARGQGDGPRYLSTNHLMGRGYWVWLIPLSSGSTSIGIVADPALHPLDSYNTFDKSMAWLDQHEPACADAIRRTWRTAPPCRTSRCSSGTPTGSDRVFSADRWACTGDAGMFLDPFYSPGSDFISISNTFITDLVCRSLEGRGVRVAAGLYERMYQTFFATGLTLYQDQYPLFGNPKVMPVKILWDYCYYWSISGPLFFTGSLTSVQVLARAGRDLTRAVDLNRRMQQFFRDWDDVERGAVEDAFLDCAQVDTAWDLNARLPEQLDARGVASRLQDNIDMLGRIAAEIVGVAQADHPSLMAPPKVRPTAPARWPSHHGIPGARARHRAPVPRMRSRGSGGLGETTWTSHNTFYTPRTAALARLEWAGLLVVAATLTLIHRGEVNWAALRRAVRRHRRRRLPARHAGLPAQRRRWYPTRLLRPLQHHAQPGDVDRAAWHRGPRVGLAVGVPGRADPPAR